MKRSQIIRKIDVQKIRKVKKTRKQFEKGYLGDQKKRIIRKPDYEKTTKQKKSEKQKPRRTYD